MSRTPGTTKAETHERIVQTAARAVRKRGYDGVSVADVMKQAGLTHGGFYAHFASREAMLEQALDRAATENLAYWMAAGEASPEGVLGALAARYLSDRHLEHPESGCTIAALGTETARQAPEVRRVATRNIAAMARVVAGHLPGGDTRENRDRALAVLSSLVGALVIARIVDDPGLSRAVRDATVRSIDPAGKHPHPAGRAVAGHADRPARVRRAHTPRRSRTARSM